MSDRLEVAGLDAAYGAAQVLFGISLEVAPGEVVALLGRNGAGKSTTLKAIMGLVRPASGSVRYRGAEIAGLPPHRVAETGLGYVPEERRIFTRLSVRENLEVGRRPARDGSAPWDVERLTALFPNLAERADNLGRQLSGGEQQMLSIARTLMGNPGMLLLDEPSEGIAPVIVEQMAAAIGEMKAAGLGVLLSEQNLHFARLVADRAVVLESGRVRWTGSLAEFDADPEVARAYLAV